MSCTAVQNLIAQFLDGRLTDPEAGVVREHVGTCRSCARDLENSRYLSELLKHNLDQPEAPKDLPLSVIRTVARQAGS
jgi:anti-sigma factor RsiW